MVLERQPIPLILSFSITEGMAGPRQRAFTIDPDEFSIKTPQSHRGVR